VPSSRLRRMSLDRMSTQLPPELEAVDLGRVPDRNRCIVNANRLFFNFFFCACLAAASLSRSSATSSSSRRGGRRLREVTARSKNLFMPEVDWVVVGVLGQWSDASSV